MTRPWCPMSGRLVLDATGPVTCVHCGRLVPINDANIMTKHRFPALVHA